MADPKEDVVPCMTSSQCWQSVSVSANNHFWSNEMTKLVIIMITDKTAILTVMISNYRDPYCVQQSSETKPIKSSPYRQLPNLPNLLFEITHAFLMIEIRGRPVQELYTGSRFCEPVASRQFFICGQENENQAITLLRESEQCQFCQFLGIFSRPCLDVFSYCYTK